MEQLYIISYPAGGREVLSEEQILRDPELAEKGSIHQIKIMQEVFLRAALVPREIKVRQTRKHKVHRFFKDCDECGKKFKGNAGLAIHKKAHSRKREAVLASF